MSAISAIDLALWDIKGKALGVTVYELLGGKHRDSVRLYANGWFEGCETPEQHVTEALKMVEAGTSELKKIATAAETYYVSVAPHNSNGPISTVASLHLDTCIPNCFTQEVIVNFLPRYEAVLTNPLVMQNGHASPPDRPRWGTNIDLDALKQFPPNDYVTVGSEPYLDF
jgi:L-alanine-DL-glutamate epimerase-like enolase superfamily enzyme